MREYEKLGSFYLGRLYDRSEDKSKDTYYLYDSKDLTTHGLCVGMTGSGKTGLCIGLLEEAAMDSIPAIIIDPKGDMANLLLSFPNLLAEDFEPWISQREAEKKGTTKEEYANIIAKTWADGLAEWDQDSERILNMRAKVDFEIYTPGSSIGKQLSLLSLADLPAEDIINDDESLQDYTISTVSSLLSLLGMNFDSINSREHILLSNILINSWKSRKSVSLENLIMAVQKPSLKKIGIMPLETFYPEKERFSLAMSLNNLVASPQFQSWTRGEALDIDNLLYNKSGKPKMSIISIQYLEEKERMFFVSTLLNKLVSWTRAQAGTSSLRAIMYMDEIYGYFPPIANPPSKKPLLTLLKQARASGLGLMLTTQNPVDLDYKGLSNIGTWFVGHLQTQRDKERLLDGFQSASNEAGRRFSRAKMDDLISNMPARVFLVNNVHEDGPELFKTRWCMSYLPGPLNREQISLLVENKKNPIENKASLSRETSTSKNEKTFIAPEIPNNIEKFYIEPSSSEKSYIYQPSLYALVEVLYEDKKKEISFLEEKEWNTPIKNGLLPVDWSEKLDIIGDHKKLFNKAVPGIDYLEIPDAVTKKTSYTQWKKDLINYIYKNESLKLFKHDISGKYSKPQEDQRAFILRIRQELRETRDLEMEKIEYKYQKKIDSLKEKIRKAEQKLEREQDQAERDKMNMMVNIGSTLLDSFFGRKKFSRTTMNKAARSARSASRTRNSKEDVYRAEESLEVYQDDLYNLENEFKNELEKLRMYYESSEEMISTSQISPKKMNINLKTMVLVWIPKEI